MVIELKVRDIEIATHVPKKFRFPYFVAMLWYVAYHYEEELQKADHGVSPRVLRSLKCLVAFLAVQVYRVSDGAKVSIEVSYHGVMIL